VWSLRSTELINAPASTAAAALRHTRTAEEGLRGLGVRGRAETAAGELLVPGDDLAFRLAGAQLRTRVVRAGADRLASILISGPLRELWHESVLVEAGVSGSGGSAGERVRLTDVLSWRSPLGPLGRAVDVLAARRFAAAVQARRLAAVRELAESWAQRAVVVGTAVVLGDRLLVQQRRYPARDAGRWELPGGRVEPGETERAAVIRECKEELDIDVVPTGRVGTDVPLHNGMLLRVHVAEPADPDPAPRAVEHRAVRWARAAELADLDWLEADRVLVHSLRELLG